MKQELKNISEFVNNLPEDRKLAMSNLIQICREVLVPMGFSESNSGGMINYSVPHSIFPQGYHCNPKQELPFLGIASQKNFIALYHMGVYANPELLEWFVNEYKNNVKTKLDMGKSCIRFKKPEQIPFDLIKELLKQMNVQEWIDIYSNVIYKK